MKTIKNGTNQQKWKQIYKLTKVQNAFRKKITIKKSKTKKDKDIDKLDEDSENEKD